MRFAMIEVRNDPRVQELTEAQIASIVQDGGDIVLRKGEYRLVGVPFRLKTAEELLDWLTDHRIDFKGWGGSFGIDITKPTWWILPVRQGRHILSEEQFADHKAQRLR